MSSGSLWGGDSSHGRPDPRDNPLQPVKPRLEEGESGGGQSAGDQPRTAPSSDDLSDPSRRDERPALPGAGGPSERTETRGAEADALGRSLDRSRGPDDGRDGPLLAAASPPADEGRATDWAGPGLLAGGPLDYGANAASAGQAVDKAQPEVLSERPDYFFDRSASPTTDRLLRAAEKASPEQSSGTLVREANLGKPGADDFKAAFYDAVTDVLVLNSQLGPEAGRAAAMHELGHMLQYSHITKQFDNPEDRWAAATRWHTFGEDVSQMSSRELQNVSPEYLSARMGTEADYVERRWQMERQAEEISSRAKYEAQGVKGEAEIAARAKQDADHWASKSEPGYRASFKEEFRLNVGMLAYAAYSGGSLTEAREAYGKASHEPIARRSP